MDLPLSLTVSTEKDNEEKQDDTNQEDKKEQNGVWPKLIRS